MYYLAFHVKSDLNKSTLLSFCTKYYILILLKKSFLELFAAKSTLCIKKEIEKKPVYKNSTFFSHQTYATLDLYF